MEKIRKVGDLDIGENLPYQRRLWKMSARQLDDYRNHFAGSTPKAPLGRDAWVMQV